ncbi:NAD(P)H-hydrate dehydratase [Shimia sagamensis]|uniref:Bifunctional NAD(P)H-hydrate repair enzyme n=1 Tax=Shimia sagamensis TaxID=1566352 RepID=A0ABY1NKY7_9RHOB|nr:NAD(P)H-hydrate dehydratase [Shimia sagamensis]SMP12446.1 yjeF C-terminal region, hydroxyethylthiazole kinase-related/yjeF N-terminal region [Shimia sagamensis]
MSELLTAAQMRAIEQAAIESGEVTGLELMERAGQGVVEAIFEEWPELLDFKAKAGGQPPDSRDISGMRMRAVVLCGPGNNGGDGFVVARLLHVQGWDVEVFLYGDAEKLPPDARANYERWRALGEVKSLSAETFEVDSFAAGAELVIDALFGTGLTRPVGLPLVALPGEPAVGQFNKLVAVDMPSGICSDSGRQILSEAMDESGAAVPADLIVSFHSKKLGHVLAAGPEAAGKSVVVDIGLGYSDLGDPISRKALQALSGERRLGRVVVSLVEPASPYLEKWTCEHKFSHGHALILSGGSGKTGAARLAARGALRIGAGLVTLGVPPNAQQEVACQITALMLKRVSDATALEGVLKDERINALCLGPGMGVERARDLVPVALETQRAVVLDADALSAYADDPTALFDLLHENVVLTPHGGEFARLFPDIAANLAETPTQGPAYSKVDATRDAAERAGCVVLFKGPDTVIASPNGQCAVNAAVYDRAAPWLATAGSGDVLAGFVTGLLARGLAPQQAAETAAWLHVECARAFGPGLIAEDLPETLPQVLSSLDNERI